MSRGNELEVRPEEAGEELLEFLSARLINESKTSLRQHVAEGRILLNGEPATQSTTLQPGDVVALPEGTELSPPPEGKLNLRIVAEDQHHLCLDKPPGWPVLPGRHGEGAEFYESLVGYLNRDAPAGGPYVRPHLVHRLDRETSGVLLVAKSTEAARNLSLQFQHREVGKTYVAVCEGRFPRGEVRLEIPLERMPGSVVKMRAARDDGKRAVTDVAVAERFGHFTLLRLHPETGRQHQIRVHLAAAGYPLAVDSLYGRRSELTGEDLSGMVGRRTGDLVGLCLDRCPLHAQSIRYRQPATGRPLEQTAPLPADLTELLQLLRREDPPREGAIPLQST
ncbi:MAG: RluA family pseudouridine synthase [Candidatus Brocadiia bacterium]